MYLLPWVQDLKQSYNFIYIINPTKVSCTQETDNNIKKSIPVWIGFHKKEETNSLVIESSYFDHMRCDKSKFTNLEKGIGGAIIFGVTHVQ